MLLSKKGKFLKDVVIDVKTYDLGMQGYDDEP
jgi:hypothetical protein